MHKFSELKLTQKVLKAVEEAGYTTPTPIQLEAIPLACDGRDILGIAQTGTGKTASFTLPIISLLNRGRARARMPRSLVLAPTRELAAQVAENFDIYSEKLSMHIDKVGGGRNAQSKWTKLLTYVFIVIVFLWICRPSVNAHLDSSRKY